MSDPTVPRTPDVHGDGGSPLVVSAARPADEPSAVDEGALAGPTEDGSVSPASPNVAWWAAGVLYRRRWWIIGLSLLAAVAAAALTLQIPNRFRAEARLLLPNGGGGLGALLGGSASGAAAALFGGGGGDYERYIAILTSRSAREWLVDQFELVDVYQLQDARDPRGAAMGRLDERSAFNVSLEYDFLSIRVLDESPDRAAQLTNAYVAYLNEQNSILNSESAMTNRVYVERRIGRAEQALDSLSAEMQGLQEEYGIVEPEMQSGAFMSALANAQAAVSLAEIQYQSLLSEFGDDNPQTQAAAAGLATARGQAASLERGDESVMPVPFRQFPAVGRRYARLQQQILVQGEILEQLQPLYEQAMLSERRRGDAVQVVDAAIPPTRKAEPRRTIIVLTAAASAFVVLMVLFLAGAWLRVYAKPLTASLRDAAQRVAS